MSDTYPRLVDYMDAHSRVLALVCGVVIILGLVSIARSGVAGAPNQSDFKVASGVAPDFVHLELQIAFLQRELTTLSRDNARLGEEVDALTRENGIIDVLIAHLRRIDGEGQALRRELGGLLTSETSLPGMDSSRSLSAPGARHQIVSRGSGTLPPVSPRMSDALATDGVE